MLCNGRLRIPLPTNACVNFKKRITAVDEDMVDGGGFIVVDVDTSLVVIEASRRM